MLKLKNYVVRHCSISSKIPFIDNEEIKENKEKVLFLYDTQKNKNKITENRLKLNNQLYNTEYNLTENITLLNDNICYFNNNNIINRDLRNIFYKENIIEKIQNINETDLIKNDIKLNKKNKLDLDYKGYEFELKNNEVIISNLNVNFNLKIFKKFLSEKNINLNDVIYAKIIKDKFQRPCYLKLLLKENKHLEQFKSLHNQEFDNKFLQIIDKNSKSQNLENRTLVLTGFKSHNQIDEIITEISNNHNILDFSVSSNFYSTNLPTFDELKKEITNNKDIIKNYLIEVIGKSSSKFFKINENNEFIKENFKFDDDYSLDKVNYEKEIKSILKNLKEKNKKIISCYENNLPEKYKNKRSKSSLFSLVGNNVFNIFNKEKNIENNEFIFITTSSRFEAQKIVSKANEMVFKNNNNEIISSLKLNTNFYDWNKNNIFKLLKKSLTKTRNFENLRTINENIENFDKSNENPEIYPEQYNQNLTEFSNNLNEKYLKLKQEMNPLNSIYKNKLNDFKTSIDKVEFEQEYNKEKLKILIKDYLKNSIENQFFNEENLLETNLPNIENYIKVNEKGRMFNYKLTEEDFNLFKKRVNDRVINNNFNPEIKKVLSEISKFGDNEVNEGFKQVLVEYGLEESNKHFINFIENSKYELDNFKNKKYFQIEDKIHNNWIKHNKTVKFNYNFYNKRYFCQNNLNFYEKTYYNLPIFLNYMGITLPMENFNIDNQHVVANSNNSKELLAGLLKKLVEGSLFETMKVKNDNRLLSLYDEYKHFEKIKNITDTKGLQFITKEDFDRVIEEGNLNKSYERILYEKDKKSSKVDLFNILYNKYDNFDLKNMERLAYYNIYLGINEKILDYKNNFEKIDEFINKINELDPNYTFEKIDNQGVITILKKYSIGKKLRISNFETIKNDKLNPFLKKELINLEYSDNDINNYFSDNFDDIELDIKNNIDDLVLNKNSEFYKNKIIPFLKKYLNDIEIEFILKDDQEEIDNQYELYYKFLELKNILEGEDDFMFE